MMRSNPIDRCVPLRPLAPADRSFIAELLDILEHAFGDSRLKISDIAKAFGMSERHFAYCLRTATGNTPAHYLTEYRLIRARHFLRTGAGLAEAGRLAGFTSQAYFAERFTRRFGETPTEFESTARPI